MTPPPALHLIIPFASTAAKGSRDALAELPLQQLPRLLTRLAAQPPDSADAYTLSPPHERALARAYALSAPDGQLPWGAWQAHSLGLGQHGGPSGDAWALVTPCHWHVGTDHIAMSGVDGIGLEEAESEALCAAMAPWFVQDGVELLYAGPTQWLARGEVFRNLATASLDRVLGRNIDAWMPEGPQAAPLRRLQNEMQMLLYHHPVNDARAERGALPINSFWLSGTGALPDAVSVAGSATDHPGLRWAPALRGPALAEDWAAWAIAWQDLDSTECAALASAMDAGQPVQLTLCGERAAQSFGPARIGLAGRISGLLSRKSAPNLVGAL